MSKNIKLLEKMTFIILEGLIKIRCCRCRTRNEKRSTGAYMEILEDASIGMTQSYATAVVFGETLPFYE